MTALNCAACIDYASSKGPALLCSISVENGKTKAELLSAYLGEYHEKERHADQRPVAFLEPADLRLHIDESRRDDTKRPARRFSHWNQCGRKFRHASESAARIAMKKIENPQCHVYRCGYCSGWHVGKAR